MNDLLTAAKQLHDRAKWINDEQAVVHYGEMMALRAALEQPADPVAWMVYTLDGKSVCVTDNPADFTDQHRVLPLYTAPQPQTKQEPEGWKLVPVEPTWDMKIAASTSYREPRDGHYTARMGQAADCYRVMLAAAPQPPQREWAGLTDEEVQACWNDTMSTPDYSREGIYRAIEAKLREKNGGTK